MAPRTRHRDFAGLEQRRKQAVEWFAKGESQAWVARRLRVSRQSVSRWHKHWKSKGEAGLGGAGRAGRKPRLSPGQMEKVDAALRQGALRHGYGTELWTLPRVAVVIQRLTGVKYHPGHVWKLLGALDWSVQKPTQQARERDAAKVRYWIERRWPEVKKTLGAAKPGSTSRTNRASPSNPRSAPPGRRAAKPRS